MNNIYYVYAYLRTDGTPYYIGKGSGLRAWKHVKRDPTHPPTDLSRIVLLKENLTESESFDIEKHLIAQYGRIDTGTGILRNRTNGGEGARGVIRTRLTCTKCGTNSDPGNYKKYHGENCIGLRGTQHHPGKGYGERKICPHCNKLCDPGNYSKYHGENCKKVAVRKQLPKIHCVYCDRFIINFNYPRYHGVKCKLALPADLS